MALNNILFNVSFSIEFWVDDRVDNWELVHGERQGFDEEGQQSQVWNLLLQLFAQSHGRRGIDVV